MHTLQELISCSSDETSSLVDALGDELAKTGKLVGTGLWLMNICHMNPSSMTTLMNTGAEWRTRTLTIIILFPVSEQIVHPFGKVEPCRLVNNRDRDSGCSSEVF